eukprot:2822268-Alexandrium_andersonii.AAC.1
MRHFQAFSRLARSLLKVPEGARNFPWSRVSELASSSFGQDICRRSYEPRWAGAWGRPDEPKAGGGWPARIGG